MLGYLNNWYWQQCNYVNNWYVQIVKGCTDDPSTVIKPIDNNKGGTEQKPEIDTRDLEVGVDEEKTVRITIPKTPAGFKGN
jgi:hypothetical protein